MKPPLSSSGLAVGGRWPSVVHVTVPHLRTVQATAGIVVHRSRRAGSVRHPSRLPPQTRVEETVLDLVEGCADLDRAIGWIAGACAQRLTTVQRLVAALASRGRLRWRAEVVDALTDVGAGCQSLLELRYFRDVERRHGLPAGVRQQARARSGGRWYDDVCYQEYATLVELDGQAAHPADLRWRDLRRDNAGVAEGMDVLRYGHADVTDRPCQVAAQMTVVLRRNGWLGTPTPCGPHCPIQELVE
jgi:very-short-patch-repair endonuclease